MTRRKPWVRHNQASDYILNKKDAELLTCFPCGYRGYARTDITSIVFMRMMVEEMRKQADDRG